jgi:hypothetical protein
MKKMSQIILLITICLAALSISSAQMPNAGFENWTAGNPEGWITDNAVSLIPITQSSDAHSGTSAMQGTTISFLTIGYPPMAYAEFAISARHSALNGWYKFSPVGGDTLKIHIVLYKNEEAFAYGFFYTGESASNYTQFTAPITYLTSDVPDSAFIEISITSPGTIYNVGSTFKIDDLALDPATDVQKSFSANPAGFALSQNYPNPFNPSTTIRYALPNQSRVRLQVFNMLGQLVTELVNTEQSAGYQSVIWNANVPSGMYFYRIEAVDVSDQDNRFVSTKEMILLK